MYKVFIKNGNLSLPIHNDKTKLKKGNILKGINTIDSFSFSIYPNNNGFFKINDFITLVNVWNSRVKRYEFQGRVLYSKDIMESTGVIYKEVVCESFLGYLNDSFQYYVEEKNWRVIEILEHIITVHNSQVEDYKKFYIGKVTVTNKNDNVYVGIQRELTFKTIREKLINKLGGEIQFRVENDKIYLDYLDEIGEVKNTTIERCKNMKSISKESNPSLFITKLFPYGAKLKNSNGEETEQRLTIATANDGKEYITDDNAIKIYGIHSNCIEFDDVTEPLNLLMKGKAYLRENNKVQQRFSVTALDLSLIDLDYEDFDVGNYHQVKNRLLNIDEVLRILKKNIDIINPQSSTLEFGDKLKSLTDVQLSNNEQLYDSAKQIKKISGNLVSQKDVKMIIANEITSLNKFIKVFSKNKLELSTEFQNIALDNVVMKFGDVFSVVGDGLKINSNINYIKVSGIINLYSGFNEYDEVTLEIVNKTSKNRIEYIVRGNNESIILSSIIIEVKANDIIYFKIKNNTSQGGILNNDISCSNLFIERY